MNVVSITMDKSCLSVEPLGNRYYRLAQDTIITVATTEGKLVFSVKTGFVSNFRSGGVLVDTFIDQIGDQNTSLVYLIHDLCYTPCESCNGNHPVTREFADEFLRGGLEWAGMGKIKRNIVYYTVRAFGTRAYEEDDHLTESNMVLFSFNWVA